MENGRINRGIRLGTMMADHIAMTFITMVFAMPIMIKTFSNTMIIDHSPNNMEIFHGNLLYAVLFGFSLYFCKDSFNGRSIAKRMFKLQIVQIKSGNAATPMQCLIRNLFILIWPIEVIVSFINPERRIGDFVAGTKLVDYVPNQNKPEYNFAQIILSLIISFSLMLGIMSLFENYIKDRDIDELSYIESSYNIEDSKELNNAFSSSLGDVLIPDIKIFDSISDTPGVKYLSCILRLKNNTIEDNSEFELLKEETRRIVYSVLSDDKFTGKVVYVYQVPGSLHTSTFYFH